MLPTMLIMVFCLGYQYSKQLLALENCGASNVLSHLPDIMCRIVSSMNLSKWNSMLATYSDNRFTNFLLRGIKDGFRIGFACGSVQLKSRYQNLISAMEHPQVVQDYLDKELEAKRVIKVGSLERALQLGIHCSPFGVIPKKHRPDAWRLILDLSHPEGHSVNDGINKELCSLSYVSLDEVVAAIMESGKGAMLAKMDIKQAYRNVPVHPQDRLFLGMCWKDVVYVDATLPFGLRSAPLIFSALADALLWGMQQCGIQQVFHYIDDFITIGAPKSVECMKNVMIMHELCQELGLPVAVEKDEGPATTLQFLGLELDSQAMEVRVPQSKLVQLQSMIVAWRGKKACKKRELLSLIGLLSHASKAIRSGRTFVRRLIDLSTVVKHLDHYVCLSLSSRADLEWWYQFASSWNGVAMMTMVRRENPDVILVSDASGSWGCGAYCDQNWFQLKWVEPMASSHITVKELAPIVVASAIWGSSWKGLTVKALCDNEAVVSILNQGTSRDSDVMHLMRCLAYFAAKFQFFILASHIKGIDNTLADALSRNNLLLFQALHPQANMQPSAVPDTVLDLLFLTKPDWNSQLWTRLWTSISSMD